MSVLNSAAWNHSNMCHAWKGSSILIIDQSGEMTGETRTGFYYQGVRFLRLLQLRINGERPHLCSLANKTHDSIELAMVYPEVASGGTGGSGSGMISQRHGIYERGLSLRVNLRVRPAGVDIAVAVMNNWNDKARFELTWLLDADFMSLDGGDDIPPESDDIIRETGERSLVFESRDRRLGYRSRLMYAGGGGCAVRPGAIQAGVALARQEEAVHTLRLRASDCVECLSEDQRVQRERRMEQWRQSCCRLSAPGAHFYADLVNESVALTGSAANLAGNPDEWLAPVAGYPLYPFLFGRDALTASWMIALLDHGESLDHALTRLGRLQGAAEDPFRDEQPGRIIQQARLDTGARLGHTPFSRYYGDFASPLMYVISQAYGYACTGRLAGIRKHWPACLRILDWARLYGDRDGDGYLEYQTLSPFGPRNQGWKDSENAIVDEEGTLVTPPVAVCEIQGYWYAAMLSAAAFSVAFGQWRDARLWLRRASALKKRFNRDFWVEDGGYIGMALDNNKRLIRTPSSNMGHCLASGIVENRHIPRLVRALFTKSMYSGWGVRTLPTDHPAYNPLSYHLGSVWPVENATIALGLRRYGFTDEAMRLVEANVALAKLWRRGWVPECIGGYERTATASPGAYPQANAPQTWNAAAFGLFTQVMLGLQPVAPLRTLFVDPALPEWLPELTLHNLTIGGAVADIRFYRDKRGSNRFRVLDRKGTLHVFRQPPVNAMQSTVWHRIGAFARGLVGA